MREASRSGVGLLVFRFCGGVGIFGIRGGPEPHGAIEAAACHEGAIPREGDPFNYAHVPLQGQGHLARGYVP